MIQVTDHAVDQYISRHATELTNERARALLEEAVQHANHLKERTARQGHKVWYLPDLGIQVVAKPDGSDSIIVTVLPKGANQPSTKGPTPEELEMAMEMVGVINTDIEQSAHYAVFRVEVYYNRGRSSKTEFEKKLKKMYQTCAQEGQKIGQGTVQSVDVEQIDVGD